MEGSHTSYQTSLQKTTGSHFKQTKSDELNSSKLPSRKWQPKSMRVRSQTTEGLHQSGRFERSCVNHFMARFCLCSRCVPLVRQKLWTWLTAVPTTVYYVMERFLLQVFGYRDETTDFVWSRVVSYCTVILGNEILFVVQHLKLQLLHKTPDAGADENERDFKELFKTNFFQLTL